MDTILGLPRCLVCCLQPCKKDVPSVQTIVGVEDCEAPPSVPFCNSRGMYESMNVFFLNRNSTVRIAYVIE